MKNNKLNKIILLVVILSFVFTTVASAVVFTDISKHWAKGYIERVAEKGLVTGYDNKTFRPDNNVTVLESLVMMSRLYEIDDDLKDEIIEKYESVLNDMPNSKGYEWSFDYLAVDIELGVVSEKSINDMFAKKTVFNSATREEVAVLLTKAMMLEGELKKVFVLKFNDADKISEVAKQYVYMMYDKEIMQGDNKKNFNPSNKITRAEMATVMDKASDYIDRNNILPEFEENYVPTTVTEGIITKASVEKGQSFIYIKDNKEVESVAKINDETKIYINEKEKKFSDLKEDMLVKCKVDESGFATRIEADSTKKVVRGIVYYVAYSSPQSITIRDKDDDRIKYDVSPNADVYLDGKKIEMRKLSKNDEVTLLISKDSVYQINSTSRIKDYEGVIFSIDYSTYPIEVVIKTKEGVLKTFEFNSKVEITKNDKESSFDRVRVGDEVTVTTEYGEMIKINTVAKEAEKSGIIQEITLGSVNKIKITDKNGDAEQYTVSSNVVVTIGDKNASIRDLRVGYNVDINTSGDEVVTIDASEIQTGIYFAGKVIFVNTDDKLIMMQSVNSNGQSEFIPNLRVTNNTKIINMSGDTKRLKDLEEGQTILCTAIPQSGEYVALSIIIQ